MGVQFLVEHPTKYRTVYRVIDEDSGEIVFEHIEDDISAAFASGACSAMASVIITRQTAENKPVCYAIEGQGMLYPSWEKAPQKRRVGKKSYWKLHPEKVLELSEPAQLALNKVIPLVKTDGSLKTRKRTRAGRKGELLELLGRRRFEALIEAGVLYEDEGRFYVRREFVGRG